MQDSFKKYYGNLLRRRLDSGPHADEALRDYRKAILQVWSGPLF